MKQHSGRRAQATAGFTIIEVMIAFSILTSFFLGVVQIIYMTQRSSAQANYLSTASSLMTYIARDVSGGDGEIAQYLSSAGTSSNNTPSCNTLLSGGSAPDSRAIPAAMLVKAFGTLGIDTSSYNNPSLYSASVGIVQTPVTIAGISYPQAKYSVNVFFPGDKTKNCLTTNLDASYR